jgi:hypothetical protein
MLFRPPRVLPRFAACRRLTCRAWDRRVSIARAGDGSESPAVPPDTRSCQGEPWVDQPFSRALASPGPVKSIISVASTLSGGSRQRCGSTARSRNLPWKVRWLDRGHRLRRRHLRDGIGLGLLFDPDLLGPKSVVGWIANAGFQGAARAGQWGLGRARFPSEPRRQLRICHCCHLCPPQRSGWRIASLRSTSALGSFFPTSLGLK